MSFAVAAFDRSSVACKLKSKPAETRAPFLVLDIAYPSGELDKSGVSCFS